MDESHTSSCPVWKYFTLVYYDIQIIWFYVVFRTNIRISFLANIVSPTTQEIWTEHIFQCYTVLYMVIICIVICILTNQNTIMYFGGYILYNFTFWFSKFIKLKTSKSLFSLDKFQLYLAAWYNKTLPRLYTLLQLAAWSHRQSKTTGWADPKENQCRLQCSVWEH